MSSSDAGRHSEAMQSCFEHLRLKNNSSSLPVDSIVPCLPVQMFSVKVVVFVWGNFA